MYRQGDNMAKWLSHWTHDQEVTGSNPSLGSGIRRVMGLVSSSSVQFNPLTDGSFGGGGGGHEG